MSINYPPTSWLRIKEDFNEIISEIQDGFYEQGYKNKIIIFYDFSKLKCREKITNGVMELFQYDYYDENFNILMKFHSEPHEEEEYQTDTEPFHMHVNQDADDLACSFRTELYKPHQDLEGIIKFIRGHHIISGKLYV
ncbi:DUF6516 family protein [Bacillus thuringiensis]|nr:DUF6516 family protein [Bacillus thuringiensis]